MSAICPDTELLSAMMVARRDGLYEEEKELEHLNILNAVLDSEEKKEVEDHGDDDVVVQQTTVVGDAKTDGDENERRDEEEEQKQLRPTQQPMDENAILDSLRDLTFE